MIEEVEEKVEDEDGEEDEDEDKEEDEEKRVEHGGDTDRGASTSEDGGRMNWHFDVCFNDVEF